MKQQAMIKEQQRLSDNVERALDLARQKGASAAEVAVSEDRGMGIATRLKQVETVEYSQDTGFGITVYFGQRKGSASTSDMSAASLEAAVTAACNIARFGSEDPCAGLPERDHLARDWPDLALHHPWDISAEQAIEIAIECESQALAQSPLISNSEGVNLSSYQGIRVYGNSLGFLGHYLSSRHSINCSLIAEKNGQMQRDYSYSVARDPKDLLSIDAIAKDSAKRTLARLGARKVPTCEVPVLFAAEVATGLISSFLKAISGGNLYREASFLLNSLGEQVFPDFMQLREDPFVKKGLASCPYDAEGVQVKARDLVSKGVVQGYLLSTYSARKLGMQPTGNSGGSHNIYVSHQNLDLMALAHKMQRGFLVTEVMGQGVNMMTGDYSRGASGFWVEHGRIAFPVEEMTIAGNLKDMFRHIVAIGNDVETRGAIHCGSILIEKMMVAGS